MSRFRVGDYVQRVGPLVPEYMRFGRIIRVIPPPAGLSDQLTDYEIAFDGLLGTFRHTELRLTERPGPGEVGQA